MYAARTTSRPEARQISSSSITSSLLLPSVLTPPTVGGVGPRVTFSKPIQEMGGGTAARRPGSTLSLIVAETAVSRCGQSESRSWLSHAARLTSGSRVHRGRWFSAFASTSGGIGSGAGLPRLPPFAASLTAFFIAALSPLA